MLFIRFHPNLLTYWAVVGFASAGDYFRRYTERERQLAQAELHLLCAQLQPHFLFNSLHTISAMMHEDVKSADRMINRLSELLRIVLDGIGKHEVPLQEEIGLLKAYVEIERIRFQDRLTVKLDVDPDVQSALVPTMILQPLAENSVRHAFHSRDEVGTITVGAHRQNGLLAITFTDNGAGFDSSRREGLGLTNTRRRLEQLYPHNHRFELENLSEGGARLTIELPFHIATAAESGIIAELMHHENPGANRRRRGLGAKANL